MMRLETCAWSAEPLPQWKGTHFLKSLTVPRSIAGNTWQGTEIPFHPTNMSPRCFEGISEKVQ